jgi:hypothetical protein
VNTAPGAAEGHMLAAEITGDIPDIIGNEANLYQGNLVSYFRILSNDHHSEPVFDIDTMASALLSRCATTRMKTARQSG